MLNAKQAKKWALGSCEPDSIHSPAGRESLDDASKEVIETHNDGSRWRLVPTGRKYKGNNSTTTEFQCVEQLPSFNSSAKKEVKKI